MPSWASILIIALGGAMLVEGAAYALFPDVMKRAMLELQTAPSNVLRVSGVVVALLGTALIVFLMPSV